MTAPSVDGVRTRVAAHLRVPILRSGYALVANVGLTSALGLVFWALAARHYPPAAVGAAAGLLAAVQIVANVAQLGYRNALIRFVPVMGPRAPQLVVRAYVLAAVVAAALALVFAMVHGRWAPELSLLARPDGVVLFVGACALWMVFVLQDAALVGARRATWVPLENLVYAVAKLMVLVVVVDQFPAWGIFVAWVAPLAVVVVPVNIALFCHLLPSLPASLGGEEVTERDLARFSSRDWAGSLLWETTIDVLPLLVLVVAGAADGAFYALSWAVAYALYLVPIAIGEAFVAEAAHDPARLRRHVLRAGGQALMIVVPAALVLVVAAPLVLSVLGAAYREEATTLLRLLALSSVPYVVTSLYVSLCRARRALRPLVLVHTVLAVGVLASSAVLVDALGAVGAGWAWLLNQSVLAVVLLVVVARELSASGGLAELPGPRRRPRAVSP